MPSPFMNLIYRGDVALMSILLIGSIFAVVFWLWVRVRMNATLPAAFGLAALYTLAALSFRTGAVFIDTRHMWVINLLRRHLNLSPLMGSEGLIFVQSIFEALFVFALGVFLGNLWLDARQYRKTVNGNPLTTSNLKTFWRIGHLLRGGAVVLTGWAGLGFSPVTMLLLVGVGLVASPLLAWAGADPSATDNKSETEEAPNLDAERERVLSMVESGRITSEEGVELLGALAESVAAAPRPEAPRFLPGWRFVVLGVALILLAFLFLPWLRFDPHAALHRAGNMENHLVNMLTQSQAQNLTQRMLMSVELRPGKAIGFKGFDTPHHWGVWLIAFAMAACYAVAGLPRWLDAHGSWFVGAFCLVGAWTLVVMLVQQPLLQIAVGLVVAVLGLCLATWGLAVGWRAMRTGAVRP